MIVSGVLPVGCVVLCRSSCPAWARGGRPDGLSAVMGVYSSKAAQAASCGRPGAVVLPSSVQVVQGCVAVSVAVAVCCAAVDAVPLGRLLSAAADRWRVSWPVCRDPAMVQRGRGGLRAASAVMDRGGRGLLACVGSRSRSGFFPNCIARFRWPGGGFGVFWGHAVDRAW